MIETTFGSATDVGRVRTENEDRIVVSPPVFAVADGMGGHTAGALAADLATHALAGLAGLGDIRPGDLLDAIADANRAILDRARDHPDVAGMGTTISGLCLGDVGGTPHWFVFNVGDSRVYRWSDGVLEQVTVDHSEVQELEAAGRITALQARQHPHRNVITRALGTDPGPAPDVWVLPAVGGDRFVVCSDGLTKEVDDDEISALLNRGGSAELTANALVTAAVAAGGHDNVTVVVVDLPGSLDTDEADGATTPRRRVGNPS